MAITPVTPGVHHIALRCSNMKRTTAFYRDTIGLQLILDTPDLIAFLVGNVILAFKPAKPVHQEDTSFTPFNIGLDHIAITCQTEEELHRFAKGLADAGVENTGVKMDDVLKKLYVAFKDPDRIQFEFYMM